MEKHGFLQYAVILLLATVVIVPLAKRWRLGAVLGYLGGGTLIGPSGLGLVSSSEQIAEFSDFGIALMLFVIGLELSPHRLWVMRRAVFGIGGLQVALTALLLGGLMSVMGYGWQAALIVGLGLALSSTAVDLQLLAERKELTSAHGRLAFSILLFQDLAALPILALIPILGGYHEASTPAEDIVAALRVFGTLTLIVVVGRYLLRPMFRAAAQVGSREVFTATALLVVVGVAWLVELAGIQMSLGAFLAGVLLADSEYRHEIEAQIDPFRGLLLGLFFIGIGMSLDVGRVAQEPGAITLLVVALLLLKGLVIYVVARLAAREDWRQAIALTALLSQGGEFAFVVFGMAASVALISPADRDLAIMVITLSMLATPLLVRLRADLVSHARPGPVRTYDTLDTSAPRVIIAGMGRFGQIIARVLTANHVPLTALDNDPAQVDFMRRFGNVVFYGDASRLDLLRAAQADKAEIFVIATEDPEANLRTARLLKRHFPHIKVFARARNRQHVFRLMDLEVGNIVRDTFFSSLEMARELLQSLGYDAATASEQVRRFREHDERLLSEQYPVYDDAAALMQSAQEARADLEHLFRADTRDVDMQHGHSSSLDDDGHKIKT